MSFIQWVTKKKFTFSEAIKARYKREVRDRTFYRKLPLPHDIFITATITGMFNFILNVTNGNLPLTYRFNSQIPVITGK